MKFGEGQGLNGSCEEEALTPEPWQALCLGEMGSVLCFSKNCYFSNLALSCSPFLPWFQLYQPPCCSSNTASLEAFKCASSVTCKVLSLFSFRSLIKCHLPRGLP